MRHILFGINYGSKLCGNTVLAILNGNKIYFMAVDEDIDADDFIYNAAKHFKPDNIFLNAPLSLPGIYCGKQCSEYHFREADKQLKALSPMFIGGVTARAMQLKARLETEIPTKVYETYPKQQACNYQLHDLGYKVDRKSNLAACRNHLTEKLNSNLFINCQDIKTWNHVDALLALFTAMRFVTGLAETFGDAEEGLIYV